MLHAGDHSPQMQMDTCVSCREAEQAENSMCAGGKTRALNLSSNMAKIYGLTLGENLSLQ